MNRTAWKRVSLGEHCEVFSGYPFASSGFTDDPNDIALIKGENIGQGEILWSISKRWPSGDAAELERFKLRPGDVVLAMDRPWVPAGLKFARIPESAPDALLVQRVARLRAIKDLIQEVLPYVISSAAFVAYVQNIGRGVGVPHISGKEIEGFRFALPPKNAQVRIAGILSAYDDLIENNRRRMALLEQAARLLYDVWFVRLRFPGHERRHIVDGVPEGWERSALGEVCTEIRDLVSPADLEPDTPYIGLEHIPRRSISLTDWSTAEAVTSTKHRYSAGDILFGKIRPYFHKAGVAFTDGAASSDAIVIRPNSSEVHSLVLMTVSSDQFVAEASQTMREGSKMPRADWKLMTRYPIALPRRAEMEAFSAFVEPIVGQLRTLCLQNRKLRAARDLLLPRLMSGEITV